MEGVTNGKDGEDGEGVEGETLRRVLGDDGVAEIDREGGGKGKREGLLSGGEDGGELREGEREKGLSGVAGGATPCSSCCIFMKSAILCAVASSCRSFLYPPRGAAMVARMELASRARGN